MTFSKERPFVLVGAGKMGGAMLSGWMAEGIDPASILVVDPFLSPEIGALLKKHGIGHAAQMPDDVTAGIILVAVKPQMMDDVLPGLVRACDDKHAYSLRRRRNAGAQVSGVFRRHPGHGACRTRLPW
jgi:pyrroline-5-carboxylate reductase